MRSLDELQMLENELQAINLDFEDFSFWISATRGERVKTKFLSSDHWPQDAEVRSGVWRDDYTGQQLDNYTNHGCFDPQLGTIVSFLLKMVLRGRLALTNLPGARANSRLPSYSEAFARHQI